MGFVKLLVVSLSLHKSIASTHNDTVPFELVNRRIDGDQLSITLERFMLLAERAVYDIKTDPEESRLIANLSSTA